MGYQKQEFEDGELVSVEEPEDDDYAEEPDGDFMDDMDE